MTRARRLAALVAVLLPAPLAAAPPDPVVAEVGSARVTQSELYRPLVDAHGLNMMLSLVRLDLAQQEADRAGVAVTDADVRVERDRTVRQLFTQAGVPESEQVRPDEYDALLRQFLDQQKTSEAEFDLAMRTNAILRKLVAPQVGGALTEEQLRQAFNARYGETVRVRHVAVANLQEVAAAQKLLRDGTPFADVARQMSQNPRTAPLGGELVPFSRQNPGLPEVFKQAAFALQPGEVSDPVQADGQYHLILLEGRQPPKAVQFEDVKADLRDDLTEQLAQAAMIRLRDDLGQRAVKSMKIYDPELKRQFDARLAEQQATVRGEGQIKDQLERERPATTDPTTTP